MDDNQERLVKGAVVRCERYGAEPVTGKVLAASETNPQSVLVVLDVATGMNDSSGGMYVLGSLALTVDYEAQMATDLWGNEWEIDVGVPAAPAQNE